MTVLSGVFVKVGTMADGTCRVTIDLDCTLSALAALNLMPGTPLAIARLTNEAGTAAIQPEPEPAKGGALAKLAGMWCNEIEFCTWLADRLHVTVMRAEDAARQIRLTCGIDSRAELDSNAKAAAIFNEKFRIPYSMYLKGRNK